MTTANPQSPDLVFGAQTARLVKSICREGVTAKMVVMRHSARYYDFDNPVREPFLGLTEEGKSLAFEWGRDLPAGLHINFFASYISRCVETAYLIDKGYTAAAKGTTAHTMVETSLAPYYVRDPQGLLDNHLRQDDFYGAWFGGKIPEKFIDPTWKIARRMRRFWEGRLSQAVDNHLDICITHDWNVYVVLDAFLGLNPEAAGKVEFLDGVVVYKEDGRLYIETPGHERICFHP